MSTTAVEKGLQFEKAVVDMLNKCGFKAWRTNQSNEADPERYKAGFDGGVDIIATFDVIKPICRNVSMCQLRPYGYTVLVLDTQR